MMKNRRVFCALIFSLILIVGCKTTGADLTQAFSGVPEYTEIVNTKNGPVAGIFSEDHSVELFAGIPFAKPPVGELRWKEPQDVENWENIFVADHFAPKAMQPAGSKIFNTLLNAYIHSKPDRSDKAPVSEDCLYLNVWRPEGTKAGDNLPVLVYVHGGSLTSGCSWAESYDGENLSKEGIIFVTIAYRTGIFGFFASEELIEESPNNTTGNYGLLDQIKALEWVHKNIDAFGGDENNVTIAGESAGSSSVNALCCSPLTKGLFRRAIGESSSLTVPVPPHSFRLLSDSIEISNKTLKEFNCESVSELRKIPAEKLIKTKHLFNAMTTDSYAMPQYPWELYQQGLNHEEALLNGFNAREGFVFTFFSKITKKNLTKLLEDSPYVTDVSGLANARPLKNNKEVKKFYTDVFSAVCFTYPHYSWSKAVTQQGRPVYEYFFSKENRCKGTNHSGEIPYAYGNLVHNKNYKDHDFELQDIMKQYWLNFIKYGDPNGEGLPQWKTVKESDGLVLELGTEVYMREDPFSDIYEYLDFNIEKNKRPITYGAKEE